MYPLTRDPLDGFSVLFGNEYVLLGKRHYSTGKFAVDVLNLKKKELENIWESVHQNRNRIEKCLAEGQKKGLLTALEQIQYLTRLVPVYRELGRTAFLWKEITDNELDAVFQEDSEYNRAAKEWLEKLFDVPRKLEHFQRCASDFVHEYLEPLGERTSAAYANAWYAFQTRRFLEDDVAATEADEYEGEEFLQHRTWYQEETQRRYLQSSFEVQLSYEAIPDPKDEEKFILAERVWCEDLETFLSLELLHGFAAGHIPRRCDHCGRFFLLDSGYDIRYCENEAPDAPGKTCSQVGAHSKERRKSKDDPIIGEYKRVYNRLKTRKNRGQLSQDDWNRQVAEIQELKDKAKKGEITLIELTDRLSGH